jgi:hypothetical protein
MSENSSRLCRARSRWLAEPALAPAENASLHCSWSGFGTFPCGDALGDGVGDGVGDALGDALGDGVGDALGCGCLQSAINFARGMAVRGGALDCVGRLLATRP